MNDLIVVTVVFLLPWVALFTSMAVIFHLLDFIFFYKGKPSRKIIFGLALLCPISATALFITCLNYYDTGTASGAAIIVVATLAAITALNISYFLFIKLSHITYQKSHKM